MPTTFNPKAPSRASLASFVDHAPAEASFSAALLTGLALPSKAIPCRFLYDLRGSALFEEICNQPEYYPTRTELGILKLHAPEIAECMGRRATLVELGSGVSIKVGLLLNAMDAPAGYVAIDISSSHLKAASERIAADFPDLPVHAICADYGEPFELPSLGGRGSKVGFYPGSTIGNSTPDEARRFLAMWRKRLGPGGAMVVGVDLKKDQAVLNAAYNDAAGVTAAFSKNLLERANREAGANFDLGRFAHQAIYNPALGCVEIHLRSLVDQSVQVAGETFAFAHSELLHVENSYKYTIEEFRSLAQEAGFVHQTSWVDPNALFGVHYLVTPPAEASTS